MTSNGYLRSFVERIERVEDEIMGLNDDKSDLYKEAKGAGFNVKTLRRVIQARRKDPADRAESDMLFETYMAALEGGTLPAPTRARTSPPENETSNPAGSLEPGEAGGLVKANPEPSEPLPPRPAIPAVPAAEPSIPSVDAIPAPYGQPDGLALFAGNQREAAPIPEPVASPSHGEPPTGSPNSRPVGGDPYADRQPPPIPDFLRRDRA